MLKSVNFIDRAYFHDLIKNRISILVLSKTLNFKSFIYLRKKYFHEHCSGCFRVYFIGSRW